MLRSTQRVSRYSYNNYNNWRRYYKNSPLQAEPKQWKKSFQAGDEAEFSYDNKIIWPDSYKPWKSPTPFEYVIGFTLMILYFDWRTDRIR